MALRKHPTKSQLNLHPSGWTVILRLGPFKPGDWRWVPTGLSREGVLYNAAGATAARPSKAIAVFVTYAEAYAAVLKSLDAGRRRMRIQARLKSDWPDYIRNRHAWSIAPVVTPDNHQ